MFEIIKKLLFPRKCMVCKEFTDEKNVFSVCGKCYDKLSFNNKMRCSVCASPLNFIYGDSICELCRRSKRYFKKGYAPFVYEGAVRKIIMGFKFYGKTAYAPPLASFIFADIQNTDGFNDIDIITYVPLHIKREIDRGYNQANLLAEHLSEYSGKPCVELLKKTVNTEPLSLLHHEKRSDKVHGVYSPLKNIDLIKGKTILLTDDILTTGATTNECAKVLMKNGAKAVYVCAAAATPRKESI